MQALQVFLSIKIRGTYCPNVMRYLQRLIWQGEKILCRSIEPMKRDNFSLGRTERLPTPRRPKRHTFSARL